jgi:hypothetical protein
MLHGSDITAASCFFCFLAFEAIFNAIFLSILCATTLKLSVAMALSLETPK